VHVVAAITPPSYEYPLPSVGKGCPPRGGKHRTKEALLINRLSFFGSCRLWVGFAEYELREVGFGKIKPELEIHELDGPGLSIPYLYHLSGS
jgi:hypothetical protein